MGDVAMVAHVAEALRAARPDMKITVLTRPFFRPFFRYVEGVEFLDFDPKKYKNLAGLFRLARDVRRLGVDAVADLHDVLRSKVVRTLLRISGTRVSVIDKGRDEKKQLTRRTRKNLVQLTPMVERYRQTITRLGIRFEVDCNKPLIRRECPVPESVLTRTGTKNGEWIGVAPFAKHKGKIYPIPLVDKLIGMLAGKYDYVFVFGGGQHEKSFAEGMEMRYDKVVSAIGKLSLSEELDLIANLDAIVTMDSSSMHMASLVGTPAVSVWGATHPYAGFYGYGQDPANSVQLEMPCRPCSVYGNKECIFGHYHCLSNIPPDMIVKAVGNVVGGQEE